MLRPASLATALLLTLWIPGPDPKSETVARFASSRHQIRVMTYNIHVGVGMDKKLDLPRIAAVIKDQRADLVGLQEVDRGVERTQRMDEIAELAKLTHMDYAFAFNLKYQGGQYGVAILSRAGLDEVRRGLLEEPGYQPEDAMFEATEPRAIAATSRSR